uniref:Uncharacterized protein n=1 Tax=Sphaerodactylus townsendi TaxID=933632 RepID=A0ACB8E7C5_9SAUR
MRSVTCIATPQGATSSPPLDTIADQDIRASSPFAEVAGPTFQAPIEESPERAATLQRRRLCRVGLLADIGQRLLDRCENEANRQKIP